MQSQATSRSDSATLFSATRPLGIQADGRELVYLVGASLKREGEAGRSGEGSSYGIEESLEELGRLADTAGLKVQDGAGAASM